MLVLAALGILGGFFVVMAQVETSVITVSSPAAGSFLSGQQTVTWNKCAEGSVVHITLTENEQYYKGIQMNVPCSASNTISWDTKQFADDSDYQVMVYNTSSGEYGLSGKFTIDNTAPTVPQDVVTVPVADSVLGGESVIIGWNQNVITDYFGLRDKPISLAYSSDGTNWSAVASGVANSGSASWNLPQNVDISSVKLRITAIDQAGNSNSQDTAAFAIETVKPTATISGLKPIIKDSVTADDNNLVQNVVLTYSEPMTNDPVITFSAGSTPTAGTGSWNADKTIWTQSFTYADGDESVGEVKMQVSGAKDTHGNAQVAADSSAFAIDTQNPTVTSASATPDPAKAGKVSVKVVFSEAMETEVAPTVKVVVPSGIENVSSTTYTVSGNTSSWSQDDKAWTGSFTLPSEPVVEAMATVQVANAWDSNGNELADNDNAGQFKVDTKSPVGTISLSSTHIGGSNLEQTVTVNFDEAMDKGVTPQLSFGAGAGVWSDVLGSWDAAGKVWTQKATVSDANVGPTTIGAIVDGAKDLAGNVMGSASNNFYVDTLNPTVALTGTDTDKVVKKGDVVTITATFTDESGIDETNAPKINIGSVVKGADMTKVSNLVWEYPWTVPDGNSGDVAVTISAKDAIYGNASVPAEVGGALVYTIDNLLPTLTINRLITKDTTPTITGTVNKAATIKLNVATVDYTTTTTATGDWAIDITAVLNDGSYQLKPTATDAAGNVGTVTADDYLTIDIHAPRASNFTTPATNIIYAPISVPMSLVVDDDYYTLHDEAITYTYQIDGAGEKKAVTFAPAVPDDSIYTNEHTTVSATISDVPDGRHTIVLYMVDKAGNESNTTSQSFVVNSDHKLTVDADASNKADFTKIQDAIDLAAPGDTISVVAGTYAENITIPAEKSGLIISGHAKADTFIEAASGNAFTVNAPVTIKGFTIDCKGTGLYGVYAIGINGVNVQDNNIKNYHRNDIYAEGGVLTITGNEIISNGAQTDFSADSIYTKGGVVATITGNTLSGNVFEPIASGTSAGISIHAGDDITATGNTISGNSIGIHAKSGSKVKANGNKIYSNTYNFYFEDDNKALIDSFDLGSNWWGSKMKSEVAAKMFNYNTFSPWYLDEAKTTLSSTDTTAPSVVVSTSDADGSVKAGDKVTITASITDDNGIDTGVNGTPKITIANGQVVEGHLAVLIAGMNNVVENGIATDKWSYEWTVPAGNASAAFSVEAYDAVGNGVSAAAGTTSLAIDNAAPVLSEVAAVATPTHNNKPTYVFNSTEAGNVTYAGGCVGSLTSAVAGDNTVTFNALADGTYASCTITVTDQVGNVSAPLAVSSFLVDTVAPVTTATASAGISNVDITVTMTATDAGSGVKNIFYCIDQGDTCVPATAIASGATLTINAEGKSYIRFGAEDEAGNKEVVNSGVVTIDRKAPIVAISSPAANAKVNGSDAIAFTADEQGATKCSITGSAIESDWSDCANGATISSVVGFAGLADGSTFTLYLRVTDAAGNHGTSSVVGLTKDIKSPTIIAVSSSKADGAYKAGEVINVGVTFSENVTGQGVTVTLVGTGKTCTFDVTKSTTGNCNYTVAAGDNVADLDATISGVLQDEAGNVMTDFVPAATLVSTRNIVIDTTAPVLREVTPVATPGKITNPTYVFNSSEAGSIIYSGSCSSETKTAVAGELDNSITFGTFAGEIFNALSDGTYGDCEIKVTDAAGNVSAPLTVSSFTVDTTAPAISGESPQLSTNTLNPTISASFSDASAIDVSGLEVSVTGGSISFDKHYFAISSAGIASQTADIELVKGVTYTVVISGLKDALGNATAPDIWTFTPNGSAIVRDITAPTVKSFSPVDGATGIRIDTDAAITFSEAMDKSTFIPANIQLVRYADNSPVAATVKVSSDGTTATIDPAGALDKETQYYIAISAAVKDASGNPIQTIWTADNKAEHEFTTAGNSFTISLQKGWNLVSLPLIPYDSSIGAVLGGTTLEHVDTVQYYDAAQDKWLTYNTRAAGNTLSTMEEGKAYWISMNANDTLTISGKTNSISPRTYQVVGQKWNMIGFKSTSRKTVGEYLPSMELSAGDLVMVYEYSTDGDFYYKTLKAEDYMEPGLGYWIYTPRKDGFSFGTN